MKASNFSGFPSRAGETTETRPPLDGPPWTVTKACPPPTGGFFYGLLFTASYYKRAPTINP